MYIQDQRTIRIFKSGKEANWARKVLEEIGIESIIKEDRFEKLTLKQLGMQLRFRLIISQDDIPKAATFLAKKLRKKSKV